MIITDEFKTEEIDIENNSATNSGKELNVYEEKHTSILKIFIILFSIFLFAVIITISVFTYLTFKNTNIISGIYIKGIDVSGLTKEEAIEKLNSTINSNIPEEITLKHNEYSTNLSTEQLDAHFDIENAVNTAYSIGRSNNLFQNDLTVLQVYFNNINISPAFYINESILKENLNNISSQLPDTIIESSYYIDGNKLIVTLGHSGEIVNVDETYNSIITSIETLNYNNSLDLITSTENPKSIDIEAIHSEIYKEPKDAYYTTNPFVVYPQENGLDFKVSLDEAKLLLEQSSNECIIPLKVTYPNITTNMIGTEAFPDLLSEFSTKYNASDTDRTTNLKLAANKINGTVLVPGQTFSYNSVVGERTIAAGYKNAAIYQNGQVVDGLGGGICQISTTLFNAVLYANLEIVQRRNNQFVPSYVTAGRDATVVYGSQDFQFKNSRNNAIKIMCSVNNGIAKFQIYGVKEDTEYEVDVNASIIKRTSSNIYSKTYRTLKLNGQIVKNELVCSDTYKVH